MMDWKPVGPESSRLPGLHPRLDWIAPIFQMGMGAYGSRASVFFNPDLKHSAQSAHGRGLAIDVNYKDLIFPWAPQANSRAWAAAAYQLGAQLARVANQMARLASNDTAYYLVQEWTHWHLEIAQLNAMPNIKGYEPGKFIYATQDVRDLIGGANAQGPA